MKIVIAPDSFKGSLSALELCNITEKAIRQRFPQAEIVKIPMADGGEGTVEALVEGCGGMYAQCRVSDPLGREIMAKYGVLNYKKTGAIEMAAASGLPLLQAHERNPMVTSSFGTGQLMLALAQSGCRRLIMGVGGSATNDGGAGMLMAVGAKLTDDCGKPIPMGCGGLARLHSIDISSIDKAVADMEITVACDVKNPLWGENGATYVFGRQKGANEAQFAEMDELLRKYGELLHRDTGKKIAMQPGSGAAGGMGAGLMACLNARLMPGFDVIASAVKLEEKLAGADLLITGEGQMNFQSVMGKLPVEAAKMAKRAGIPAIAIVGAKGEGSESAEKYFAAVHQIMSRGMTVKYSMENSAALVYNLTLNMELCL